MPLKTFLKNKINSNKFRLNGLVPSSRLPYKRQLCQTFRDHIIYRAEQLPPKVDMRSDMTPVEDQSRIGSCAANCLAGAYEYLTKKANGRNTDVSRLFIYYNGRVKDQKSETVADSGCTMTSAIEALEELGTCLETIWPYDISRVNTRPNDSAYQEANRHKITEALRINIDLHEMKACLAQGFPFAFGLKLYTSFDQAAKTGVVPMPNTWDNGRDSHASHALLAVGYSDQSNAFIVRNSWGEQWGDQGYCYIPYSYLTNPNLCFDVWTVRKLATDDFGRDHWDSNDRVNYARPNKHERLGGHFDDNSRVIESFNEDDDTDDNYNRRNDFDNGYNRRNYFDDGYSRRNDFNDPSDQFQIYAGGNNYNRKNDFDDRYNRRDDFDDGYNRRNDSDDSYDQYRISGGGNNYSKKEHRHHHRHEGYPGNGIFYYDQFRETDNYSGFRGGYSDFDQFVNNGPNFFPNQFPPPPPFPMPQQQYGQDYGYSSPFNNFFNPYF